jgi:hypothetical protein
MGKDCPEIKENLGAFMDEELEAEKRGWVEEHLKICPPCERLYRLIVGVKNRIRGAGQAPATPPHLRGRVLQALDRETAAPKPWWSWSNWMIWAPAPILAMALVLSLIFSSGPNLSTSHNFAEISLLAMNRFDRGELHLTQPGTPLFEKGIQLAELQIQPGNPVEGYRSIGCCFGLQVDRPVAHYLFKNDAGEDFSLIMWKGNPEVDAIPGDEEEYDGRSYFTMQKETLCLIMWRDGSVYCSVAGRHPMQDLIRMAAKIRK